MWKVWKLKDTKKFSENILCIQALIINKSTVFNKNITYLYILFEILILFMFFFFFFLIFISSQRILHSKYDIKLFFMAKKSFTQRKKIFKYFLLILFIPMSQKCNIIIYNKQIARLLYKSFIILQKNIFELIE